MNSYWKGLLLAAIQVILVASPAAKLKLDRARYPRLWVKTQSIDPNLPIRGRYVAMRLPVQVVNTGTAVTHPAYGPFFHAKLFVREGKLTVEIVPTESATGVWVTTANRSSDEYVLQQPVLFFLPEHVGNAQDLMAAARNGELWAEVTVPSSGLPRPIRLGIKHGDSFTAVEAK